MITRSDEDKQYTSSTESTELIHLALFPTSIIELPKPKIVAPAEQKIIETIEPKITEFQEIKLNETPKQKITEIQEIKRTEPLEQKIKKSEIFQNEEFVAVNLWPNDKIKITPNKVLALDVDETIIDYEASQKNNKLVFINLEKLKQKIAYAKEHNVVIVFVTSRKFEPSTDNSYLSVNNIAKELGLENFDYIFYTNGKCKSMVMQKLWNFYFQSAAEKLKDLCLVDDNDKFIRDCFNKNLPIIKTDKNDTHAIYLDEIQHFLDGALKIDPWKFFLEEKPDFDMKCDSLFAFDTEGEEFNITFRL